jgi:hypothetical protein
MNKTCKKCGETKAKTEFVRHAGTVDGYICVCKVCNKARRKEKAIHKPDPKQKTKVCSMCEQELKTSKFSLNGYNRDGYNSYCKDCKSKYQKEKGYPKKYLLKRKLKIRTDVEYRDHVNAQKRRDRIKHKVHYMVTAAKQRASKKGLDFNIEKSDIVIPEYCPILGVKLINGNKDDYEYTPSLDRIDPTKGYVKGNIQVISKKANSMKNNANEKELLAFANWIFKTFI